MSNPCPKPVQCRFTLIFGFIFAAGPFGDLDEEQVFMQRIIPETDTIFVRLSSDGKRYVMFVTSQVLQRH